MMHDREDEDFTVETPRVLDPTKEFTNLLLLLDKTTLQLSDDRKKLALMSDSFSDKLEALLKKLDVMASGLSKKWEDIFHKESALFATKVSEQVNKTIQEKTSSSVTGHLKDLSHAVTRTANQLDQCASDTRSAWWKFLLIGIAATVIGGMIGGGLIYRLSVRDLVEEQQTQLRAGEILQKAWSDLSKKEQDRIMELAKSKK